MLFCFLLIKNPNTFFFLFKITKHAFSQRDRFSSGVFQFEAAGAAAAAASAAAAAHGLEEEVTRAAVAEE